MAQNVKETDRKLAMEGQELKETLGRNIKLLRFHANLSQAELAEKAALSINFVSELERGNKWPRADTLASIGEALDVPVSVLFNDHEALPADLQTVMVQFSEDMVRVVSQSMEAVRKQYAHYLPDSSKT
jgi:transcriptional regulator with XRE-family HTH domain